MEIIKECHQSNTNVNECQILLIMWSSNNQNNACKALYSDVLPANLGPQFIVDVTSLHCCSIETSQLKVTIYLIGICPSQTTYRMIKDNIDIQHKVHMMLLSIHL